MIYGAFHDYNSERIIIVDDIQDVPPSTTIYIPTESKRYKKMKYADEMNTTNIPGNNSVSYHAPLRSLKRSPRKERNITYPVTYLMPPKHIKPNRRSYFDSDNDYFKPRPFKTTPVRPTGFKKIKSSPASKLNLHSGSSEIAHSIRDILGQQSYDLINTSKPSETVKRRKKGSKMRLLGSYKHPKRDSIESYSPVTHSFHLSGSSEEEDESPHLSSGGYLPVHRKLPFNNLNLYHQPPNFKFLPPFPTIRPTYPTTYDTHQSQKNSQDGIGDLYQDLIKANNNRLKQVESNKNEVKVSQLKKNAKPFSLMLDIYPMTDDETSESSHVVLRRPKAKHQYNYSQLTPPPPNLNALNLNQNLQYSHNSNYFNQMKFHQLRSFQTSPSYHMYNNLFYRDFHNYNRDHTKHDTDDNKPSKIMVHLNLYPKSKNNLKNNVDGFKQIQSIEEHAPDTDEMDDQLYWRSLNNLPDLKQDIVDEQYPKEWSPNEMDMDGFRPLNISMTVNPSEPVNSFSKELNLITEYKDLELENFTPKNKSSAIQGSPIDPVPDYLLKRN